jgi:hypothetical protein
MAKKGETLSEETRAKIAENARERTGEKNPFFGKTHTAETREKMAVRAREHRTGSVHSEATKQKMSQSQKGRVFSEETKQKMRDAAQRRCANPKERERLKALSDKVVEEGLYVPPPVLRGVDHPNYGKPLSEERKQRLREAHLGKPGMPHTDASRTRISEGNASAIRDRKRTYKYWVNGPDGQQIPCRSDAELMLVQALMKQKGIVAIRGEDKLPFVQYEIDGQPRLTVADFEVDRADGVTVVIEGKAKTAFYVDRSQARLLAMWGHCQRQQQPFLLAVNGSPVPSVWAGPFVSQAFMNGLAQRRVRQRLLECAPLPGESVLSSLASKTSLLD